MNTPKKTKKSPFSVIILLVCAIVSGGSLVGCASLWNKSKAQQEKIEELDDYAQTAAAANKRLADSNKSLQDQVGGVDARQRELKAVADAALTRQTQTQEKLDKVLESLESVETNIRAIRTDNQP